MVAASKNSVNRKKRHVSKKSKTSWRKNVDIQDVEDFLEDQRLEERLGTRFADKPDSELFVIDTVPSDSKVKEDATSNNLTPKHRKRISLPAVPRCFHSLVNTSKVPEPSGKRNYLNPKGLSAVTEQKRIAKEVYKKKWDVAEKNRQFDRNQKKNMKDLRWNTNKDLWDGINLSKVEGPPTEWLSKDTIDVNKPLIKPAKPKRKVPKVKPISIPHPGTSYNPSYKDHQNLLQLVIKDEIKDIKEETHVNRVTSGMFRKITSAQKLVEDLKELRQGLDDGGHASDGEDSEYRTVNPPVVNKKRSRKTKTHIRREKLIRAKKITELTEKKKLGEIYKLRFIQKAIIKKEGTDIKLREKRKKNLVENPPLPRINTKIYKEPPAAFVEPKELTGNLRGLVPKGSGLSEHFTSLQRRGLAPMSVPLYLKKANKKRYTLPSHKMPWQITEGHAKPSKRSQK